MSQSSPSSTTLLSGRSKSSHLSQRISSILRISILMMIMVVVNDAQKTEKNCVGEFEFWACQSSTKECQRNCENRGIDRKKIKCKLDCQKACVCEAGYLRKDDNGECVYETECGEILSQNKKNIENQNRDKVVVGGGRGDGRGAPNRKPKQSSNQNQKNKPKSKPKRFIEIEGNSVEDSDDDRYYDQNENNGDGVDGVMVMVMVI
ncbi:hypothetical protein SSS_08244 [Sarcoptes scabiei]|uniref:TIL domain-containing protein n=1 Tax=Sarcoptes scabiei TaxID=52283 RepID=A0A834R4R2_SARSC|nr:hypothetical protein SSS_08244 [Sarcoptes scabiei]